MIDFETELPTLPTPAEIERLTTEIANLKAENLRVTNNYEFWLNKAHDFERKINNAAGVIRDYISENGEVSDELRNIAKHLDVPLMKEIAGEATFRISFTAKVPLDFDADDFEISFDASCETYEAEDFEWNEEDTDVEAEEV